MTLICSTYRVLTRVSKKPVWHWILSLKLKAFTRVSKKTVWHWISLKLKFLTNLIEKFYEAHVETRVSKKTAWHWISLKFKALINLVEKFCEAHVDRCYDTNCTGIVKVATNCKYVQCTVFQKAYILSGSGFHEFLYSIIVSLRKIREIAEFIPNQLHFQEKKL